MPPRRVLPAGLPGDPSPRAELERLVRVDHAGEYGARRIYEGQIAVLGRTDVGPMLRHMRDQELEHLDYFERAIAARHVRPTALQPVWHVAGYALGAATALMGRRAAMACTVAVEEVIDGHYAEQAERLPPEEAPLKASIERFRAEELEHRDIGIAHEAEQAPAYALLSAVIKATSRAAIWISSRV
ncbi:demethoxyubiquinone hydroxylase family protein [Arenibaculum pallidiluteum]|uniref:demethoxyubiquinone hydroxylase family protein n=1 Tax=Arenibaculum pallidiluteum TaxID=2812559 RepID=UPI001A96C069|nr:demethoxyubiquinone hydroxylase family protein [Arenibaculum pallidiluteum]